MANGIENLKPFTSEQSREKAKANGRKGGIASGEAKRARKTFRKQFEEMLEMEFDTKQGKKSAQEIMTLALMKKAMNGDTKALSIIRDTIGEKPLEKVMVSNVSEDTINEIEELVNDAETSG